MSSHYETLGVAKDATPQEIKSAYRKLARKLHPDVNPSEGAAEQFKLVTRAYEVLSDEKKRANFDATGDLNGNGQQGFGGGGGQNFGGFGDIFEQFFGGGQAQGPASRTQAGRDALITITIDLEDAVKGTVYPLEMETAVTCKACDGSCCRPGTSPVTCETCHGAGQIQRPVRSFLGQMMTVETCPACRGFGTTIPDPCNECNGEGRVREHVSKSLNIPAGVDSGTRIQLRGQGEAGPGGGPNGNLFVEVDVRRHKVFERAQTDLHAKMTIPMTAAALGCELKLETFDGEQQINVESGAQDGDTMTLPGLGVPRLRGGKRGDVIVHLQVETPTKLDAAQRELLEQLAELRGEKLTSGRVEQSGGMFSRLRDKLNQR
ncbi:molecular chaperone DnaJ [Glutamicibacter bergerei]|uniref:Chaperone protein DnaJ n=2 Tax=Glutamicibacter TaxID=1742989 RepID=A0ABV9MG52_9MICC|nr:MULTISPECIES: molecular chaperone DnaJ [Glutamicibacter]PCC31241.1 molecular chaperone DnaJ [Glutamicibacter sp. BW77]GGJ65060.1 chaperone protein DnaJ 2 [Glutamicibacter ardleyensis]